MNRTLKNKTLIFIFFLLCSFAFFAKTLSYDFTDWDDPWLITQNPIITKATVASIKTVVSDFSQETRKLLGKEYLPVRDLAFMTQYRLFGNRASGYHATNVALYALACFLLYLLFLHHFQTTPITSLLLALLYLVHPTHVESVAWISEIKSLLSIIFLVSGLHFFLRFVNETKKTYLALAMLCFSLGTFSKSTGIVFLPLSALCVWHLRLFDRSQPTKVVLAGFLALALLSIFHFSIAHRVGQNIGMVKDWMGASIFTHILTIPILWMKYLWQMLIPFEIKTITEITPATGIGDIRLWASLILFIGLSTICWIRRKTNPTILFSFLCFLILLLPALQIIPIPNRFASRYLFLPSLALCFGLMSPKKYVRLLIVGLICFFSYLSMQQMPKWKNCVTLWEEAAGHPDYRELVQTNLFRCYKNTGHDELAFKTGTVVLSLNPSKHTVWTDLAELEMKRKNFDKAKVNFENAYRIHHNADEYSNNLAVILLQQGRLQEAERILKSLLQGHPNYAPAWRNRAWVALAMKKPDLAKEYFQKSQRTDK